MKKTTFFLAVLLLAALLCSCAPKTTLQTEPTVSSGTLPEEQQQRPPAQGGQLAGVWENRGQYSEGQEFVETMMLRADGTAMIHLEYQGADYQTLQGTYETTDEVLTVHLENEEGPYDKVYTYRVDGDTLTLTSDSKDVSYTKIG